MPTPPVISLHVSDIHFSETPPPARRGEPDWLAAQMRPWKEIHAFWMANYQPPIFIAGDIFDHWKPSPNLINFVIDIFQRFRGKIYAIPGQHDLAWHNYELQNLTGYRTLYLSSVIVDMKPGERYRIAPNISAWGFPWGFEITPPPPEAETHLNICISHKYVWRTAETSHVGADEDANIRRVINGVPYDFYHFGDNHKQFKGPNYWNPGPLTRRHSPDRDHVPAFAALLADGFFSTYPLSTTADHWTQPEAAPTSTEKAATELVANKLSEFVVDLQQTSTQKIDFHACVRAAVSRPDVEKDVAQFVLQMLDNPKD